MQTREISRIVNAQPSRDGAGVKINRISGFEASNSMDPFLMLDEIHSDRREEFEAGFPPHPHRGFETVTYMREGGFSHTDSMGNTGTITTGGAQWMTAGSGVIHSEMPGPDADRKTDEVWTLINVENYRRLVVERRWPPEQYETWLAAVLAATIA